MFDDFENNKSKEKTKTDIINEERLKLKKTMMQNLKNIGFSKDEIKEVVTIIDEAELEIQMKKDALVGSNINNDHVQETMKKIFYDIRQIELKMASDIKAKIAEIKARR